MGQISIEQVAEFARQIQNEHALGAEADAGFDGGEWSCAAHDRMEQAEIEKLAELHGFTYGDVMAEIERQNYDAFLVECDEADARARAASSFGVES